MWETSHGHTRMIVAFDLDGTLCNIEHRLWRIKDGNKDWPGFFRDCINDVPVKTLIGLPWMFRMHGWRVEVWSGRSDIVRKETETWLRKHRVWFDDLRMRKDGDYRADDIVKGEWLDALPENARPSLVFDDRKRVVDMWRSRGIKCCQVEPGEF